MSDKEVEDVLEELNQVRPEKLNDKTKRLFEAIMKIADERDKAKSDLYEANNRIVDLMNIIDERDKIIDDMVENYNLNVGTDVLDICAKCKYNNEDCHGDYCKDALIKYFEERCKNAENKS